MSESVTIAIAKTGTFTDSRGKSHTFTEKDFDEIAANYSGATEKAPLVFGHPEDDHPAYGWTEKVFRQGQKLFAQLAQVPDAVRKAVHNGSYKYVSMSLHPGGKRLRHVGLLGAVPPAIPGLGPVEMSGGDCATIEFSAGELKAEPEKGETAMGEEMEKRMGAIEEQVKELVSAVQSLTKAREEEKDGGKKAENADATKTDAEKELDALKAEFSAYRKDQDNKARAARLEKLVSSGKVTPGESKDVLVQAEALARIPEPMEFSDGSKESPEERFWRTFEAREPSALVTMHGRPAEFSQPAAAFVAVNYGKKI